MATVDINAAAAAPTASPNASPRERAQQRLGRLVASLEAVASRIDSEGTSQTQRTVLRTRFNDLQRQVNQLDGIVSSEGYEARGQDRVSASNDAPVRAQTEADRVEIATENAEAAAPPPPPPAPVDTADGVDLVA